MRRWALVLLALVPAACGGSSHSTPQKHGSPSGGGSAGASTADTTPTTTTTRPATTPTTGASVPATRPATTTAPPGGAPPCTAATLDLSFLGQQGATGHGLLGFALRNRSGEACRTDGFPGVLFLDRAGSPLPTQPDHVTHDLLGAASERPLVLRPGAVASFRLVVTHGNASSAGCVTAAALQVIPPDDTHTLRVAIPGGAYECTTVTVTPLQSGPLAYPSGT
jgi:hypothetical protein